MINMRCKAMRRKVKFFDKLYDTDGLDDEINKWIEEHNKKLIDVKLTADWENDGVYVKYTATVIYTDRTERKQNNGRN